MAQKRLNESSHSNHRNKVAKIGSYQQLQKFEQKHHRHSHQQQQQFEEPRFTFEEVKEMIEKLLAKQTRASAAVSAGLKKVNFDEIAVEGHSVSGCKELIEQLVQNTRRVRTLQEVLLDIKDNLKKRAYTEIIHRATLKGDLPKKPPSAYLLYHQDRYNELRSENSLAVEVSKIVAEEWKTLSDKKRKEYQRRHDELVKQYERDMQDYGLVDDAPPKRPKAAKTLYVENALSELKTDNWSKEWFAKMKEQLGEQYDSLAPEEKQLWIQLHKDNQERYQIEREEYIAAHPHLDHAGPEKKPRANERIKLPEPPKSACKFFLQKKMPEGLEGTEYDEMKKRLKDKFAHLKNKKLLKYVKKAIQDKERYDKEVEEFKKLHPGREVPKTKTNISKDQLKLYAKVVDNQPTLPAPTAYLHYCGKMLTDMNDNDDGRIPTARMQTASEAWKQLSEYEKKNAEREHVADIQRYLREMDAWIASKPEERRIQVLTEEPKANPDYWRKKLNRIKKAEKKNNPLY